MMDRLYSAGKN